MIRRKIAVALLCALALISFTSVAAQAAGTTPTIALVDVQKILSDAKAAKSLQTQIQAKREQFQKEFAAKEKEIETAKNSLIAEQKTLSAEEFQKKGKAYEQKVIDTRKLFEKRRNALEDGVSKAMNELRKNIVESAAKIADAKGYDIVLTRDSVLIAEKSLDITADVLTTLDAQLTDVKLKVE